MATKNPGLLKCLREDFRSYGNRSANATPAPNWFPKWMDYSYRAILGLPNLGFWGVLGYRISHFLYEKGVLIVPNAIQALATIISGAEISFQATVGPGLHMIHSRGIVIGRNCFIGRNVTLLSNVTLGDLGTVRGHPILGDNCYIGTGAKVLGKIVIGKNAIIGANAVVLMDIPDNAIAAGIPAKIVKYQEPVSEGFERKSI